MLKRAWYLADTDYWAGLPNAPRLPEAPSLMVNLNTLFGDEGCFDAAHTAAAVEIMLRMAEHLSDSVPHARTTIGDTTQTRRLLRGFNLLTAYLAQFTARLGYHADSGTGPDLKDLSPTQRTDLTHSLVTASCRLEETAALFKEALLGTADTRSRQVRH